MTRIRRRLTYANLAATLALFIALGGSALAVSTLNGRTIERRSIPGNRLEKHAVGTAEVGPKLTVHRAQVAGQAQLAGRALTADRSEVADRTSQLLLAQAQGGGTTSGGGVVQLSTGETALLLSKGPFRVLGQCSDAGQGIYELQISVSSTEGGWKAGAGGPYSAGERVVLGDESADHPEMVHIPSAPLLAPSGAALNLATEHLGVHLFNGCVAALYAVS